MLETLRIAVTLGAFASFLGIVWWAYAPSRKDEWERKGLLDEDDRIQ
jgi:cbb3-type cytochrome oxidase subunit 3